MPPSKSILQKGPSLDHQGNMTPTKPPESLPEMSDISNPMGRRSSSKPLPQNVLTLEDLMPSSPTSSQYPQSGTPTSISSQNNPYLPQGGSHPLSQSQYSPTTSYQQQPQQQQNQYGQQMPYGQYAHSHYGSNQNVDQYGNYGQGFQNQYQTPGYANQQVTK